MSDPTILPPWNATEELTQNAAEIAANKEQLKQIAKGLAIDDVDSLKIRVMDETARLSHTEKLAKLKFGNLEKLELQRNNLYEVLKAPEVCFIFSLNALRTGVKTIIL